MQHQSQRFANAVARNLAELQRAILNRNAMVAIESERASKYAIFRIAYLALFNDYMAHAMKVFEKSRRVASFWYLYRSDSGVVDRFMRANAIEMQRFEELAEKLKLVRDTTHFHIDARNLSDTKRIWRNAGIKGSALAATIDDAWNVVCHLQEHHGLPSVGLLTDMQRERLRLQVRQVSL